eukprot:969686-Pelagomonas_calceolata.AAC.4
MGRHPSGRDVCAFHASRRHLCAVLKRVGKRCSRNILQAGADQNLKPEGVQAPCCEADDNSESVPGLLRVGALPDEHPVMTFCCESPASGCARRTGTT